MFSYYGSKSKIVGYYPKPEHNKIIEPFAGSGTTGIACKIDGFNFVGLELSEEYGEIARARIEKFVEEREFIDDCKIFES